METSLSSLITAAEAGDSSAPDALFAALYSELHRLARHELARGGPAATLGATSLLHEAYLDISRRERLAFPDRSRFMAYAARVMRGLIIDYARRRQAQKRGGGFEFTSLTSAAVERQADGEELARLSDALDELAAVEPALAQVVDLKFFCGFTLLEIAEMQSVTERTVQRHWDKARIYLHRSLRDAKLA
ncbi:MAG TPA: ECF-type sigma factor [Thermoanaerobaculia bacterium]